MRARVGGVGASGAGCSGECDAVTVPGECVGGLGARVTVHWGENDGAMVGEGEGVFGRG